MSSGKEAEGAVRNTLDDLNSALSAHPDTFRSIVLKCQQESLITPGVSSELLDPLTGRSIQDRASQLVINLQTTIGLQPECLDTFLCILKQKGGVPGRIVAQNIAKECKSTSTVTCSLFLIIMIYIDGLYRLTQYKVETEGESSNTATVTDISISNVANEGKHVHCIF